MNQKHLLLLKGHNSDISLAFAEFAEEHNIILLCFPAHAMHLLQPLNVPIFGPLKLQYSQMILSLAKSSLPVSKAQFLSIYIKIQVQIMNPRAVWAAFKSVGIDNHVSASMVLAQLPDHDKTPEPEAATSLLLEALCNSQQWMALASKIHSLEQPDHHSHHLWGKMIKAAGQLHDDSVLLHQEVAELCQNLVFRQIRAPGDQSWLSKAWIIDSQEIRDTIQCKNAIKTPPKHQKRAIKQPSPPSASSPSQESSLEPSMGLYSSSGSSLDGQ
ncbi:related to transposase [Sporisorium scitamineum]|uniref:Related to transposase n=1 Tax=Sporisorium scitamineum TaxID=49012 RepID=A0A127ZD12_9BASI|nr:related to transposase [Sporisorium scitamineum]